MTVHSWGAVTPGSNDIDSQIKCIRTCKPALQRWKNVKVLIIDEGSIHPRRPNFSWMPLSIDVGWTLVRHIGEDSRPSTQENGQVVWGYSGIMSAVNNPHLVSDFMTACDHGRLLPAPTSVQR
ncbi:hypothetical protein BKA82DRAFT_164641 [Pisolithus tinctorius]|nr:hypothetical protein BKA82DRAFT_164641 [Pisolithus tinctorius]